AFTQGVISGVFFRCSRHDRFRHIVFDAAVDKDMPVVFTEALSALPKGRLRPAGHINAGEHSDENEVGIVKSILGGKPEFTLEVERRQMGVGANRAVIGNDSEDSLGLLTELVIGVTRSGGGQIGRGRIGKWGFSIRGCGGTRRVLILRSLILRSLVLRGTGKPNI